MREGCLRQLEKSRAGRENSTLNMASMMQGEPEKEDQERRIKENQDGRVLEEGEAAGREAPELETFRVGMQGKKS